jgi:hypothetical protein
MTNEERIERAERYVVKLLTSQYRDRISNLESKNIGRQSKVQKRWIAEAKAALQAAEDDARIIFREVIEGRLEP